MRNIFLILNGIDGKSDVGANAFQSFDVNPLTMVKTQN